MGIVYWVVRRVLDVFVGADTVTALARPRQSLVEKEWKRRTVYFPVHSLELVKAIKNAAGRGTTVNDVEFALVGGAIRRYLLRVDPTCNINAVHMRALTPAAMPNTPAADVFYHTTLRNYFTFLSTDLPRTTSCEIFMRHSMVFSNVPGPQSATKFCGSAVQAIYMVFPNTVPQIGIISYNGNVYSCLTIDDRYCRDLDCMRECFAGELRDLASSLQVPPQTVKAGISGDSDVPASAMFAQL